MGKEFMEVGKIVSTHGIKGELKVQPWCDGPEFMENFDHLYLDAQGATSLHILGVRGQKGMAYLRVEGIDSLEAANPYRGKVLYMRRSDVQLEEGEYFIQELIGLQVMDADQPERVYGKLTDVSPTGANDVYHITTEQGKELLIPAIPQVIIEVDLPGERMLIRPMEGLLDAD